MHSCVHICIYICKHTILFLSSLSWRVGNGARPAAGNGRAPGGRAPARHMYRYIWQHMYIYIYMYIDPREDARNQRTLEELFNLIQLIKRNICGYYMDIAVRKSVLRLVGLINIEYSHIRLILFFGVFPGRSTNGRINMYIYIYTIDPNQISPKVCRFSRA